MVPAACCEEELTALDLEGEEFLTWELGCSLSSSLEISASPRSVGEHLQTELCPSLRVSEEGQTFSEGVCDQFLKYTTTAEISDKVGPDLVTVVLHF